MQLPGDIEQQILRDGYAVVRELLSPSEIERLRASTAEYFRTKPHMRSKLGRNLPDAAGYLPEIHWLYEHPNIVAAMRAALGAQDIVFTRHCDVHLNRLSGWHKDSNGYFTGDFFADHKLGVYKLGLYLEDHRGWGGLSVRPRTHRTPELRGSHPLHIDTRAGDGIIFDVRLTHRGQPPRPLERVLHAVTRLLPRAGGERVAEAFVRAKDLYWKLTSTPDRYALFFTYGLNGERTAEFCRTNMQRQIRQNAAAGINERADDCSELGRRLAEQGVLTYGATWRPEAERSAFSPPR